MHRGREKEEQEQESKSFRNQKLQTNYLQDFQYYLYTLNTY